MPEKLEADNKLKYFDKSYIGFKNPSFLTPGNNQTLVLVWVYSLKLFNDLHDICLILIMPSKVVARILRSNKISVLKHRGNFSVLISIISVAILSNDQDAQE